MLFNSLEYAIFLMVALFIYFRLNHKAQNLFLLAASYLFYSFWDYRFLSLIIISTVVDFSAGLLIRRARARSNPHGMRVGLLISVASNLIILGFFKYFNFFIDSAEVLLASLNITASLPFLSIALPVGISFYTFQTLSYTIDVYRGELEPTSDFWDFALFVSFFPQLVAGPIERAATLLPQVQHPRIITQRHWDEGLYLIFVGLVRKVVIADTAGAIADTYFQAPQSHTSIELLVGVLLYALQIYGDFSGYSNIARGSAKLLGFELMRNFHHPYFATNPSDFWRRWHISLSTWLRDYLYIPLGGNRSGNRRTYLNLLVTMLLGGLWHGASWNFVFWGFLHGMYLAIHRALRVLLPPQPPSKDFVSIVQKGGSILVTFALVCFAWLFFRLSDFTMIPLYLSQILEFNFDGQQSIVPLLFLGALLLLIDLPQALTNDEYCFLRLPTTRRTAYASLAVLLLIFSAGGHDVPFIYFQF